MVQRQTVLIIDSDQELGKLIGSYLNLYGIRTHYASRVNEAMLKLDNQKYACVLLEPCLLPEKSETIIRSTMGNGHLNLRTPFVLMTAALDHGLPRDIVNAIRGIVPKPFELPEVGGAIQAAIYSANL